jgi:hypothetical protein
VNEIGEIVDKQLSPSDIIVLQTIELHSSLLREKAYFLDWLHIVEKFKNDDGIPLLYLDRNSNQILNAPAYSKETYEITSELTGNRASQRDRDLETVFIVFIQIRRNSTPLPLLDSQIEIWVKQRDGKVDYSDILEALNQW